VAFNGEQKSMQTVADTFSQVGQYPANKASRLNLIEALRTSEFTLRMILSECRLRSVQPV
jgi:hypothetical protein